MDVIETETLINLFKLNKTMKLSMWDVTADESSIVTITKRGNKYTLTDALGKRKRYTKEEFLETFESIIWNMV